METVLVIALCLLSRAATASVERLPEPGNVHFSSMNLRNIVKWTPGEGSPNDTVFSVEYAKYGEEEESGSGRLRWRRVKQCRSITHSECDVSQETSDSLEQYYARVRAVSAHTHSLWSESTHRFDPMLDTVIGPPHVEVNLLHNYMNVTIKGPFRWRTKRTKEDSSLMEIFSMIYNLFVFNSRSNHTNHMRLTNGSVRLGPLDFSTRFCVVVYAECESIPLAYKPSEQLCVETPKDPFRDQLLAAMLGGVLPSALCLCVLAVLGGLIHCYITDHRQTLPKSAHVARLSEKLQTFQPPSTIIINVLKMGRFEDEWSALSAPALPQPVSAEDSSAAQTQALNAVPEPPVSYALRHEPPPAGSGALPADAEDEDEDSRREDAEPEPWPQEPPHSEAGDYGIVLRCPAELSPYRAQGVTVDPTEPEDACEDECEDEQNDEEVEARIFLDWSPATRELTIPLMGMLGLEDEPQIQTEAVSLLPNVVLRQSSEEGAEQDDDFTKLERNWGLIIHSNPE